MWVDQSKPNPIPGPCLQPHLIARTIHPLFTNQPTQKKKGSGGQKKRAIRRLEDGSGQPVSRDPLMERLGEIINQVR